AFGGRTAPRKPDELWDDPNYRLTKAVKVQSSKVMRTRPLFKTWQFEATGLLDTEILDLDDLRATAVPAGGSSTTCWLKSRRAESSPTRRWARSLALTLTATVTRSRWRYAARPA